jgi:hypothetical protein
MVFLKAILKPAVEENLFVSPTNRPIIADRRLGHIHKDDYLNLKSKAAGRKEPLEQALNSNNQSTLAPLRTEKKSNRKGSYVPLKQQKPSTEHEADVSHVKGANMSDKRVTTFFNPQEKKMKLK